jgi:hypothetical protein
LKVLLKLITAIIVLTLVVLLILFWSGFRIAGLGLSTCNWAAEIESRGWRVLYSNQTGNRFIAVCDAEDNQIAIVDSEWNRSSSSINIMDSEHHGITVGGMEPITCTGALGLEELGGFVLPIRVPADGRIRVVRQAAFRQIGNIKWGGEILLDVEVDWNAREPVQEP